MPGRDELKDMKEMVASMGRSASRKRRSIMNRCLRAARATVENQRNRGAGGCQGRSENASAEQCHRAAETVRTGALAAAEYSAPLVAAITHYDKTIDEVARDNAMPHLEREIEHLQSMAVRYMRIHLPSRSTFKGLILDDKIDKADLVRAVKERPETVWGLAWQEWSLRRQCRAQAGTEQSARPLSHVGHAAENLGSAIAGSTPVGRMAAREARCRQVPGLSPKSEAILKAFDQLDQGRSRSSLSG